MPNHDQETRHTSSPLIISLVLTIALTLLVLFTFPRIVSSIKDSGMVELVRNHLASTSTTGIQEFSDHMVLVFPVPDETYGWRFEKFTVEVTGPQIQHKTLELLFSGPDSQALSMGAVTFIPKGTRLIGLTISRRVAFINVSDTVLDDTVWADIVPHGATDQIETTLIAMDNVDRCVILVEGTPIDSTR